ncbi:hypothetical protein DUI87_23893 [Hirundo rustica rustica]|uniref:Uncharacterized protein n=1 Tax=Hirundo rustica rustica TaxID=333673 RepID=A0A3M0JGZ0_HIRRU|nr:hypothetical protein DUI87_23893 [Hirundo rustica rustica]
MDHWDLDLTEIAGDGMLMLEGEDKALLSYLESFLFPKGEHNEITDAGQDLGYPGLGGTLGVVSSPTCYLKHCIKMSLRSTAVLGKSYWKSAQWKRIWGCWLTVAEYDPECVQLAKKANGVLDLYQEQCGQQDHGSDRPPVLSTAEATPVSGFSLQKGHRGAGTCSEKSKWGW